MDIIPILCALAHIVLVLNENCVATLLIGNLPFSKNWSYLEISKISSYPPFENRGAVIDVQIFNSAQIDKISKNQTDSLLAFGKIISSLM